MGRAPNQTGRPPVPPADRFWRYVNRNGPVMPGMKTECWEWTGGTRGRGYGAFYDNDRKGHVPAHRFAYEMATGRKLPPELQACHRCDNPRCVRADCDPEQSHIFAGTHQDNMDDRTAKGRSIGGSRGEQKHSAVVTEAQVIKIRRLYADGSSTQGELGRHFGLNEASVGGIVTGRTWRHVGGPITRRGQGRMPPLRRDTHPAGKASAVHG